MASSKHDSKVFGPHQIFRDRDGHLHCEGYRFCLSAIMHRKSHVTNNNFFDFSHICRTMVC